MTDYRVDAFVEALLGERNPEPFPVLPHERDVLRLAIELRAERSEIVSPEPSFVDRLHHELSASLRQGAGVAGAPCDRRHRPARGMAPTRPLGGSGPVRKWCRGHMGSAAKLAAAALAVAATFGITQLADHHSSPPPAKAAASAGQVRSGVLLSAGGQSLGRAYAYTGSPSWVFMDVHSGLPSGIYDCHLLLVDGETVTAGVVTVYNGAGDWAHTVDVPASQLRTATLVTQDGTIMARAQFS